MFSLNYRKKSASFYISLIIIVCLNSCVRYTAPRSEIASEKSKDEINPLASSEEFDAHEKRLKEKLNSLIISRKGLSASVTGESDYKIGPGDLLSLRVFGFSELSSDTEVSSEGTVSLPMIGGKIPASGLSVSQLQDDLTKRLKRFVNDPRIQLTVKDFKASRVFVVGEVAKPGTYALKKSGQQIIELLSEAGGRTDRASGRVILIPASTQGSSDNSGVEINIDDMIGNVDSAPLQIALIGGDTIIVPEAGSVEVYGEVEKPGSYNLASRTSALGAVASAGGFTYAAKVDEVEIIREIGGKKASMVLNLEDVALKGYKDMRLRDGDIVRVPSESGSFFRRQVVDVINGTFRGVGVNAR